MFFFSPSFTVNPRESSLFPYPTANLVSDNSYHGDGSCWGQPEHRLVSRSVAWGVANLGEEAARIDPRPLGEFIWLWLSKPFWDPILVGLGEFTTHFIESDVHWGLTGLLTHAWPFVCACACACACACVCVCVFVCGCVSVFL